MPYVLAVVLLPCRHRNDMSLCWRRTHCILVLDSLTEEYYVDTSQYRAVCRCVRMIVAWLVIVQETSEQYGNCKDTYTVA